MFQRQMCLAMCPVVVGFLLVGSARADAPADGVAKIRKALEGPTSFEFIETPLRDCVEYLKNLHEIPIRLDETALDEIGVGADAPLTRNLKGISLRSALNLLLEEEGLTYTIKDESLLITTPEVAEFHLQARVYPVRDLIFLPNRNEEKTDRVFLSLLIQVTQSPHTWDSLGGSRTLTYHSDSLVISQNPHVHDQVASLLAALRELPPLGDAKCGQVTTAVSTAKHDLATRKIHKTLEEKSACEFIETPLRDVIEYLKDLHKIEMQIDQSALHDEGIGTDTPVTENYKGITLRSALHQILHSLNLNFVIRDEVLVITTQEAYQSHLPTVLYPVYDLLDLPATAEIWEVHRAMAQLADVITTTVEPESWDGYGGSAEAIRIVNRAALVVAQTDAGHEKVAGLLARLRAVRAKQGPSEKPSKTSEYRTIVYQITHQHRLIDKGLYDIQVVPPADLRAVILKTVVADSWNDKQVMIEALPGRLIVRQKHPVLLEVRRLLYEMGLNPQEANYSSKNLRDWRLPAARLCGSHGFGIDYSGDPQSGDDDPQPGGGGGFFRVGD